MNTFKETSTQVAITCKAIDVIKKLLNEVQNFSHKNIFGQNVLHYAAIFNCIIVCEELLKRNLFSSLHTKTDDGKTALHLAIVNKSTHVLRFLIRNDIIDDVRDADGKLTLQYCTVGENIFHSFIAGMIAYNRRHRIFPIPTQQSTREINSSLQHPTNSAAVSPKNDETETAASPTHK